MTARERKSDFKLTVVTSYRALTYKLWGVCYDNFEENQLRYNGTTSRLSFKHTGIETEILRANSVNGLCRGDINSHSVEVNWCNVLSYMW